MTSPMLCSEVVLNTGLTVTYEALSDKFNDLGLSHGKKYKGKSGYPSSDQILCCALNR